MPTRKPNSAGNQTASRARTARRRGAWSRNFMAMRLDSIRRVFDSDAAIADALGVSRAQPPRWREGQVPEPENADRVAGLDVVIEMLTGHLAPEEIPEWLNGINPFLGDRTPLSRIRQGHISEVIAAVEASRSEVYA